MDNVLKSGYLECFVRGVGSTQTLAIFKWQRRFYVLYGATANHKGRLDYYDNEDSYTKEPKVRKTIYLEEVREAAPETCADKPHTFQLHISHATKRSYRFAAANIIACDDWLKAIRMAQQQDQRSTPPPLSEDPFKVFVDHNVIYEPAGDFQQYVVEVQKTEAAKRCHLKIGTPYDLYVMSEYLSLTEKNKRIITWSYKHIRRYGCGENNFTFEVGRKSLSGEGLFSFVVKQGAQLFRNVQWQMKEMWQKQQPEKDEFNALPVGGGEQTTELVKNYISDVSSKQVEARRTPPQPPVRITSMGNEIAPNTPLPQKPKLGKIVNLYKTKQQQEKSPKPDAHVGEAGPSQGICNTMFQSELNSKLAAGLLIRDSAKPTPAEEYKPLLAISAINVPNRMVNEENYELAKSTLPLATQRKMKLTDYCETEEPVLDVNYTRRLRAPTQLPAEHEYAMYDICGSTRFQGKKPGAVLIEDSVYDNADTYSVPVLPHGAAWLSAKKAGNDAALPIYDTPAEASFDAQPTKMSEVIGKLNKKMHPQMPSDYDHISLQPEVNRTLPSMSCYDEVKPSH